MKIRIFFAVLLVVLLLTPPMGSDAEAVLGNAQTQDDALKRPPLDHSAVLKNSTVLGAEYSVAVDQGTSDAMEGSVVVSVFLVESASGSPAAAYSWTESDQAAALTAVRAGLDWWEAESTRYQLHRPLRFRTSVYAHDNPVCQVPYEPVAGSSADSQVWVSRVMENMGLTSGSVFDKVAAFNASVRASTMTDYAYSIFLAYNPTPAPDSFTDGRSAFAYLGGPYVVGLWRSFAWPLRTIVTHESGHIFWACDEYFQPGYATCSCLCDAGPRSLTSNDNCMDLTCSVPTVPCIMRLNEDGLCRRTPVQVGWGDPIPVEPPPPVLFPLITGIILSDYTAKKYSIRIVGDRLDGIAMATLNGTKFIPTSTSPGSVTFICKKSAVLGVGKNTVKLKGSPLGTSNQFAF